MLGNLDGTPMVMYVGELYSYLLTKLFQHPKRMSLVGALAALCELVPGVLLFPADRRRWAGLRSDSGVNDSAIEAIELQFRLSFPEVGKHANLNLNARFSFRRMQLCPLGANCLIAWVAPSQCTMSRGLRWGHQASRRMHHGALYVRPTSHRKVTI